MRAHELVRLLAAHVPPLQAPSREVMGVALALSGRRRSQLLQELLGPASNVTEADSVLLCVLGLRLLEEAETGALPASPSARQRAGITSGLAPACALWRPQLLSNGASCRWS